MELRRIYNPLVKKCQQIANLLERLLQICRSDYCKSAGVSIANLPERLSQICWSDCRKSRAGYSMTGVLAARRSSRLKLLNL